MGAMGVPRLQPSGPATWDWEREFFCLNRLQVTEKAGFEKINDSKL